jgi:gamma-glutamylcyclotransferase
MDTMLYFSYGSNMSTPRLTDRVPSARAITIARLHNHKLKFHKKSDDGSGKCDAEFTNDAEDVVYGVVFQIFVSEKGALDKKEGLGKGYEEKKVTVIKQNGETLDVVTYYATRTDLSLKPYDWYKEHVIRGAREHGLPLEYIAIIDAINSMSDPKKERHEKELSIYR